MHKAIFYFGNFVKLMEINGITTHPNIITKLIIFSPLIEPANLATLSSKDPVVHVKYPNLCLSRLKQWEVLVRKYLSMSLLN
jgi:hypothetical protein